MKAPPSGKGKGSREGKTRGSSHAPPTNAWPPGTTGNPAGGVRKGMSIAETIRTLKALTPAELRMVLRKAGGSGKSGMEMALASMPQGVALGMIKEASAMIATICEPQAPILNYLADRDEGKVVERRELSGPNGTPLMPRSLKLFDDSDSPEERPDEAADERARKPERV